MLSDLSETSIFDLHEKDETNRSKMKALSGVSTVQLCPQHGDKKYDENAILSRATALAECSAAG